MVPLVKQGMKRDLLSKDVKRLQAVIRVLNDFLSILCEDGNDTDDTSNQAKLLMILEAQFKQV